MRELLQKQEHLDFYVQRPIDRSPDMSTTQDEAADPARLSHLLEQLDGALDRLNEARSFAKSTRQGQVLDLARRILALPGGVEAIYGRAQTYEAAGVFEGTDWSRPEILQPTLATNSLRVGNAQTVVIECLSELRLLAVANGDLLHPSVSAEQAHHFLAQVLALNLNLLFGAGTEAERGQHAEALHALYRYLAEGIGYENIFDQLIDEMWRILSQRPIKIDKVIAMVTQISICLANPEIEVGGARPSASRLIGAVYGPTHATREDPGLEVYTERLAGMDATTLGHEASGLARAMHDTGLVSPYHATFLRHLLEHQRTLIPAALGVSSTGQDALLCYQDLVHRLIEEAIHPETAQAIYGLTHLLERGILYMPSMAPALWRQIYLPLDPQAEQALTAMFGPARPPRVYLLAGVLSVLGQPLGIGQGNNPTCQSARALSMWSYNDPDYLLQMLTWAARDGEIVMHFEGQRISSRDLQAGLALAPPIDVDAASAVMVPHLDRIYMEMGRQCAGRGEDPHRWVNPEFHGWWVGRGFAIAVDVATGKLQDYPGFVRNFYGTYHPYYNGNQPIIHPQPAGVAVTDSAGRFVGWHAIAILRVAIDQDGGMRVYFYNPNNDSGQDWGHGVMVSTQGRGEIFGESSLPVAEFASRLYLFHFDPLERGNPLDVPAEEVDRIVQMGRESWAVDR